MSSQPCSFRRLRSWRSEEERQWFVVAIATPFESAPI